MLDRCVEGIHVEVDDRCGNHAKIIAWPGAGLPKCAVIRVSDAGRVLVATKVGPPGRNTELVGRKRCRKIGFLLFAREVFLWPEC